MIPLRARIKTTLERGIVWSGAAHLARRRHRGDVLILAYHNVVPTGCAAGGDRSLHIAQRAFAAQLDLLMRTHELLPLIDVVRGRAAHGRAAHRTRPRAAITFDDAYQGAVTCGVAELVARGLPATIFVSPAYVERKSFWWDALSPGQDGGLPEAIRTRALTEQRGREADVRAWAAEAGQAQLQCETHMRCATLDELHAAAAQSGITLASHSWSHPNLTLATDDELARELTASRTWLEERFNGVLPVLSYPYGLADARVQAAARAAGYEAAVLVTGGFVPRRDAPPHALPRLNIPAGVSPHGFTLRAAGMLAT